MYKTTLFSFLPLQLLPLATGNIHCSISKIRQHNPAIAFEGYTFAHSKCDFQISHVKIYHNVNFQLSRSCESEDIPILVLLRVLSLFENVVTSISKNDFHSI